MAVTLPTHFSLSCSSALPPLSRTTIPSSADQRSRYWPSSSSAPACSRQGCVSKLEHKVCRTPFAGDVRQLTAAVWSAPQAGCRPMLVMGKAVIQFIRGINEQSIPQVKLTRSKDETNGVANFSFDQPSVFDSSRELGDITGIYMIDDEGVLSSVDVNAKFVNGKPAKIEARYVMRNPKEWDRFMRFMENYANENGLGFVKN